MAAAVHDRSGRRTFVGDQVDDRQVRDEVAVQLSVGGVFETVVQNVDAGVPERRFVEIARAGPEM